MPDNRPSLPPTLYTREYFETECQGHEEFFQTAAGQLPARLATALDLGTIGPGVNVLDVGSGRGEFALHCARRGAQVWGLDYAPDAVQISGELWAGQDAGVQARLGFQRASATQLPLAGQSFDLIYMLDIVEHLYPWELHQAFCEAARVLKPGGRLIIHTMPNTWYYRFGYPLYRFVQRLRGQRLPANPEDRWQFTGQVHVNKQNPLRLKNALRGAGLEGRVYLANVQSYEYERNRLVRVVMLFLTQARPFKWVFCNDIFAIVTRK